MSLWPNVGLRLGQCHRQRTNSNLTLGQHRVFTGVLICCCTIVIYKSNCIERNKFISWKNLLYSIFNSNFNFVINFYLCCQLFILKCMSVCLYVDEAALCLFIMFHIFGEVLCRIWMIYFLFWLHSFSLFLVYQMFENDTLVLSCFIQLWWLEASKPLLTLCNALQNQKAVYAYL